MLLFHFFLAIAKRDTIALESAAAVSQIYPVGGTISGRVSYAPRTRKVRRVRRCIYRSRVWEATSADVLHQSNSLSSSLFASRVCNV